MVIDLRKWDQDIENFDTNKHKLYREIHDALQQSPMNVKYMWRKSWASVILAYSTHMNRDKEQYKLSLLEAIYYAKKAIKLNPMCLEAYIYYCTALKNMGCIVGIRENVRLAHEIKKNLDIAFSIDPTHYRVQLLYGCYYQEPIPNLTWYQKNLARFFCIQIPSPSYDKALAFLVNANRFKPDCSCIYLLISKVLIAQGQLKQALQWMRQGLQLGFTTEEDVICRRELLKLRYKYSK